MKIQKRIVNSKKHTIGYVIDGKPLTRNQAVKLAERGKLHNVYISNNKGVKHIKATPERANNLYDLPTYV
jgi:uncharacterized pyridoxamine 5'-phosphate oxidase family protein